MVMMSFFVSVMHVVSKKNKKGSVISPATSSKLVRVISAEALQQVLGSAPANIWLVKPHFCLIILCFIELN